MQEPINEVDLLQAAESLTDLLRPGGIHAVDLFKVDVVGRHKSFEPVERAHQVRDGQLRKAGDATKRAVAAGAHALVKGVDLALETEQLGQPAEVQELLVRQAG